MCFLFIYWHCNMFHVILSGYYLWLIMRYSQIWYSAGDSACKPVFLSCDLTPAMCPLFIVRGRELTSAGHQPYQNNRDARSTPAFLCRIETLIPLLWLFKVEWHHIQSMHSSCIMSLGFLHIITAFPPIIWRCLTSPERSTRNQLLSHKLNNDTSVHLTFSNRKFLQALHP